MLKSIFTRKRSVIWGILFCLNSHAPAHAATLLSDAFNYPDGLITNEYAFWSPGDSSAATSPIWEMDSGSFFAVGGQGWTGVPDDKSPNVTSSNGTNSSIFRLDTKRNDFADVQVSFDVLNQGLTTSPSTPAVDWDGLHIWLHYQSEYNLYYTSINRRDNTVVIKKKVPGGPSNGGTYYELSDYIPFRVPYNTWQHVKATVKNNSNGSVTLQLFSGNTLLVSATDDGTIGGPPIRGAGRVGMRGDNANMKFDNFLVTDFATTPPVNPPPVPSPSPTPTVAPPVNPPPVASPSPTPTVVPPVNPPPAPSPSPDPTPIPTVTPPVQQGSLGTKPHVYPVTWFGGRNNGTPITFEKLAPDSIVTIFSRSGDVVSTLTASAGSTSWDLRNQGGSPVASGVYMYVVKDETGKQVRGKFAIIK